MSRFHLSNHMPHEKFLGADRKQMVAQIAGLLTDGDVHYLDYHGLLRTGKSSIMEEVERALQADFPSKRVLPVLLSFNLFRCTAENFWTSLIDGIEQNYYDFADVLPEFDFEAHERRIVQAIQDGKTPISGVARFFRALEQTGIRLVIMLDEFQSASDNLFDTADFFLLCDQMYVSIVLIGRLSAQKVLGQVVARKRWEAAHGADAPEPPNEIFSNIAEEVPTPFQQKVIHGFTDRDMDDYWAVFRESYDYECTPDLKQAIESYAGRSPYLLALIGWEMEKLMQDGRRDEITADWVRRSSFFSFRTYFEEGVLLLRADGNEKRLLNVLLGDLLVRRTLTQQDYSELENAGYLFTWGGEVLAISRRFTDYFIANSNGDNPYEANATVEYMFKEIIKRELPLIGRILDRAGLLNMSEATDDDIVQALMTALQMNANDIRNIHRNAEDYERRRGCRASLVNFFNPGDLRNTILEYWRIIFQRKYFTSGDRNEWEELFEASRIYRNRELAHATDALTERETAAGREANRRIIEILRPHFTIGGE